MTLTNNSKIMSKQYYSIKVDGSTYECINRHNKRAAMREARGYSDKYYIGRQVWLIAEDEPGSYGRRVAGYVREYNKSGDGLTHVVKLMGE